MKNKGDWSELAKLEIWTIQIEHLHSEDGIKSDGYCGFVAIDALISHSENPMFSPLMTKSVRDHWDRKNRVKSVRMAAEKTTALLADVGLGDQLDHSAVLIASWVATDLEAGTVASSLPMENWMSTVLFNGLNESFKFSRWEGCIIDGRDWLIPFYIGLRSGYARALEEH